MFNNQILELIDNKINELRYQTVHLRMFIDSDQERKKNIEFTISHLKHLRHQIKSLLEHKKAT